MIGGSIFVQRQWWRRIRDWGLFLITIEDFASGWGYFVPALTARQPELFAVSYAITPIGQAAMYMLVLAAWSLVIWRTLPVWGIWAIIYLGINFEYHRVIDGHLFHALSAIGIHPSNNPQWIKMVLISWASLILLAQILFRRTRTIDRMFMAVISSAIFCLVTLFHFVIVEGALRSAKTESAAVMQAVIKLPEPVYSEMCSRLDLVCYGWRDGEPLPDLAQERPMVEPLTRHGAGELWHSWLYTHNSSQTNLIQAGYWRQGGQHRLIIDDGPLSRATWQFQTYFYALQLPAVYSWLFGGLLLLWLHKRALARRRAAP